MVELFSSALKVIEKNIVNFFIMFIAFLIISFIVYGIFTFIISITVGAFFGYLVTGIDLAIALIIFTWYIASLTEMSREMISNNSVDYVKSIKVGLNNISKNSSAIIAIAVLGFIGGFIAQFVFGHGVISYYDFGSNIIEGIFYAIAVGIALSEFVGKRNGFNFIKLFDKVNKVSPNAGITLYIITVLSIIPGIGVLQFLIIGLPVMILVLFNSGAHVSVKKEVEKKSNKTQK